LGGNVSGLIRQPGSLRVQLESRGIDYRSVDLVPEYFSGAFAQSLGVNSASIFPSIFGAVGDLQALPMASNSLESVVSADVIEHVPNPSRAMSEIKRVLQPNGVAIIIVPSLYKLDAIHATHVEKKRYSSHKNKLTFLEWMDLIEKNGLTIDSKQSRPIGILSGLLYLAWLDSRFVPRKDSELTDEVFFSEAKLFRQVKKAVSSFDSETDNYLLENPTKIQPLMALLKTGNIKELLSGVKQIVADRLNQEQTAQFDELLQTIESKKLELESLSKIQELAQNNSNLFLGNSVLFVVKNT
jgi:SAM-dependent methyltransferase